MNRLVTLFTGQWADLPLEDVCRKAAVFGYDGLELACWGDHFDVAACLSSDSYCRERWNLLRAYNLKCVAVSAHLVGQCVCDEIDERHRALVPERVWGGGEAEGVRQRAAAEMMDTARAAARFFGAAPAAVRTDLERAGGVTVNGFTGSAIWGKLYAFPPMLPGQVQAGFDDFARRWTPILDVFGDVGARFALEVHPTEIAFDTVSARRALEAVKRHRAFGFNFDPSHFAYQNADALGFIHEFGSRIFHTHMKDVWWADRPMPAGIFGGHTEFGDPARSWDFRSPGRGRIDFEAIIRALNHARYQGPLSVEWEDTMMDREHGAAEACGFVKRLDFRVSGRAFDQAFGEANA